MNLMEKRGCFYIFKIFTNHQILLCNFIYIFLIYYAQWPASKIKFYGLTT